jgi:hypothetical protein
MIRKIYKPISIWTDGTIARKISKKITKQQTLRKKFKGRTKR